MVFGLGGLSYDTTCGLGSPSPKGISGSSDLTGTVLTFFQEVESPSPKGIRGSSVTTHGLVIP